MALRSHVFRLRIPFSSPVVVGIGVETRIYKGKSLVRTETRRNHTYPYLRYGRPILNLSRIQDRPRSTTTTDRRRGGSPSAGTYVTDLRLLHVRTVFFRARYSVLVTDRVKARSCNETNPDIVA